MGKSNLEKESRVSHKRKVTSDAKKLKTFVYHLHASKRLKQRFGPELTIGEHKRFIKIINKNRSKLFVAKDEKRKYRNIYKISHKGRILYVVYDLISKSIVTVLPEDNRFAEIDQKRREKKRLKKLRKEKLKKRAERAKMVG